MESTTTTTTVQAENVPQLCEHYRHIAEKKADLRTGIEWERFGIYTKTCDIVPYHGDTGYQAVMRFLHEKKGWHIEDEEGKFIFMLNRGISRITVEGDGRPEISAAPFPSLHIVAREIKQHKDEIDHISRNAGIAWLAVGYHPFASAEEIPMLPKKRYQLFSRIFPDHEDWIHTYMRCLSGIHLNFGYTSEENLIRKTRVLYKLTPLLSALFSSSPFADGKQSDYLCYRRQKLLHDGPGQEKMMDGILNEDFSLEKWIQWYADKPVILFPFDQEIIVPKGFTFTKWMKEGYEGRFPTIFDFDQHVKTRWTDVRFRPSYIEYRAFDSLPFPLLMGAAAYVKGLIFDRRGWKAVEEITKDWTEENIAELNIRVCKEGLKADIHGKSLISIARDLLSVSAENLKGYDRQNELGVDERLFLTPVEKLLKEGKSVAVDILEFTGGDPKKLVDWIEKDFLN